MPRLKDRDRQRRGYLSRTRIREGVDGDLYTKLIIAAEGASGGATPRPPVPRQPEPATERLPSQPPSHGGDLLGSCPLPDFNAEEQSYSVHVRDHLLELLKGHRNELNLLTRYHQEPDRLGAVPAPDSIDSHRLRLGKVEEILASSLRFRHDGSAAGPASLSEDRDRRVFVQTRDFPSRFPHIVIQRTDSYDAEKRTPITTNWCAYRLQNQSSGLRTNRTLDAVNLGVDILKLVL